jgi:hypothetical protein
MTLERTSSRYPALFALSASFALLAALVFAACGRSIVRELHNSGTVTASDGSATDLDGGPLMGADGSSDFFDSAFPDISNMSFPDVGPPDTGDDCADLRACCMTLPRRLRPQCEMVAMGGDANQCQQALDLAHRIGFCRADSGAAPDDGGTAMFDGGPFFDSGSADGDGSTDFDTGTRFDGGRRRRDGGARDAWVFDAGPLGPNCSTLVDCCGLIPGRFQQACLMGAAAGDENQCGTVVDILSQFGFSCSAVDAG